MLFFHIRWLILTVALWQWTAASDDFEQKISRSINAMKISLQNWEQPPPPLESPPNENLKPTSPPISNRHPLQQRSLIEYCRRLRKQKIQFGACSPTYLVCESTAIRFEHCPTGEVFIDDDCKPAAEQSTCFDSSSNQLNHATEKLATGTGFCRTSSPQGFVHLAADNNECSRQALICGGMAGILSVACPKGSALRAQDLSCVPAAQFCHFVHKSQLQPIKTHLEHIHCNEHMNKEVQQSTGLSMTSNWQRCQDWFVTCAMPEKEFVFCGPNSLFDREKGQCRPTRPNDNCPNIFNCRGFEWRIIPFGRCRPEFIFCRGLTSVQFQCRPEFVLKDDKCVSKKHVHEECESTPEQPATCEVDERKADNANCTRFYQCETKTDGALHWRHYECPEGEGYDPHLRDCSTDYKCRATCKEGQSFVVSCYEYFRCHNGRYQSAVCPSKSRFSVEKNRCVFDPKCQHRGEQEQEEEKSSEEKCEENEFIKSKDCISYGVCKDSFLHWKPCQLPSGKIHPQCPDCSQEQHSTSDTDQTSNPDEESNFSPTECTDGSVVIGTNDCSKFLKCYSGHFLMVQCPNDKFFSLETQACTADQCEPNSGYLLSPSGPESLPDLKPPPTEPEDKCKDSDCCDAESPKLPISTDCQRFRECDLKTHRYIEMQCPYNEHFNEVEQQCVEGKNCEDKDEENAECPTGALQPMPKCGYARLCLEGKWNVVRCKKEMAFLNGQCSKTVSCEHAKDEKTVSDECHDGQTKKHPFSCNKYLVCDHGVFIERICSYGALFNPKRQRCDLNYECDYENQPKCYEGQLKANRHNCHAFLRCVEGAFVEEVCPKKRIFDDELKACKKGKCDDESEENDSEDWETDNKPADSSDEEDESPEKPKGGKDAGPPKGKCTEAVDSSGYRRDRNNCAKFYQCANGNWIPKDCPSGTVFNTPLAVCDWPRNVPGCE
ncbi:Chitin binding Peritrophin-A domain protein [Aphelenchoides besseyi]|nr:Chitin binding Peritrophin-A domain protein [Aphelenchoides besseyi]